MAKEQDHPDISPMVQPPIVALLFIVIAYFLGRFVPLPFAAPPVLQYLGLALAFLGFLLGISAFLEFRKAHTTLNPHGSAKHLVTSGIYRFTRNPMYLGMAVLLAGLALKLGSLGAWIPIPVFIAIVQSQFIRNEEIFLTAIYGDAFRAYQENVRRWL